MPQELLDRIEALQQWLPTQRTPLLIVADQTALAASGAKGRLRDLLAEHDAIEFTDFHSNPGFEHALAAAQILSSDPSRVVVAIGGGAALDTAKIACFGASNMAVCCQNPIEAIMCAGSLQARSHRLVAIPTTAGTGSEATHFAVVYLDSKKYSLCHDSLLPDAVILDPTLTHSLPKSITASTGLDALSQGIESLWSINSTPKSEQLAEEAIRLASQNLDKAVHHPTPECRSQMLRAANLAGRAINITRTSAPHALSYHLTTQYGVPHGFAVAISLGEFLAFNAEATERDLADSRGLQHLRSRLLKIATNLGGRGELTSAVMQAKTKWQMLLQEIGAPTTLTEVGIVSQAQKTALQESVNLERLANNPRRVSNEDLTHLLERIG